MTFYKDRLPDSYMQQEGIAIGLAMGTPLYVDSADVDNIYLGYCRIDKDLNKEENMLICKVITSNDISIKYFAYGKWVDRATLQYK